jgi:hypothetical protein
MNKDLKEMTIDELQRKALALVDELRLLFIKMFENNSKK